MLKSSIKVRGAAELGDNSLAQTHFQFFTPTPQVVPQNAVTK